MIYRLLHNLVVHPLLGISEFLSILAEWLHDFTAKRGWPEENLSPANGFHFFNINDEDDSTALGSDFMLENQPSR